MFSLPAAPRGGIGGGRKEDQEMAEVEVSPSVNSLVEAFLGAFRLEDDAFLLDDGLVCVGGGR